VSRTASVPDISAVRHVGYNEYRNEILVVRSASCEVHAFLVPLATHSSQKEIEMGKGDKRTRRGKIYRGSYGKTRPGRPKKKDKKK